MTEMQLRKQINRKLIIEYAGIVECIGKLGYDVNNQNFKQTPQRCARAFGDFIYSISNINRNLKKYFNCKFKDTNDEMVVATNISVTSLCPHHLIPVELKVWLGYIPNGQVLGLSKLIRIAQMLGHQPILQESYATQLAEIIQENLKPLGVGVYVKGKHGCMSFRGVRTINTEIITSKVIGNFKTQPATREEFLAQCRSN